MHKIFEEKENRPKVFFSYSNDNPTHVDWVVALANQLRAKAGVNAVVDKFLFNQISDLDSIMNQGFQDSDKVVIIATTAYATKAASGDSGVGYEAKLATIVSRNESNEKLIFVKREKTVNFNDVLPFQFKDTYAIDMSNDDDFETKFKELYFKIYNKPLVSAEPIGDIPFDIIDSVPKQVPINSESVFSIIEKSGFEPYNVNVNDFDNQSIIIWPVVPRQHVNLIHSSQIEVIRVLSLLGWEINVILANCGQEEKNPSKIDIDFKDKLEKCFAKKGITNYKINFLHNYFSRDYPYGASILSNFVKISSSVKIKQLQKFNTKDDTYDIEAQTDITNRTTLKYISPLFTWSAAIHEADCYFCNGNNSKAIVIAGKDEFSQWSHLISEINPKIGAIFIPVLKQEDSKTVYQELRVLFLSKQELIHELGKGNMDRWLFQSFTNLAEFPKIVQSLPFCTKKDDVCKSNSEFDKCLECIFPNDADSFSNNIDRKIFVNTIFPRIEH